MPHIALRSDLPGIRALLAFRPDTAHPLGVLTDILLRGANTLSPGERELIAAHVSRLNACGYCYNSHAATATCHFNDDGSTVAAAVADASALPVKLQCLLALAERVQMGGHAVHPSDIARARAAGATDVEIHDTVLIAALFCLFNRYVDGLGTEAPDDPSSYRDRAAFVAEHGYAAVVDACSRP